MRYTCKPFLLPLLLAPAAGPPASAMPPRQAPRSTAQGQGLGVQDPHLVAMRADLEREQGLGAKLHQRIGILLSLSGKMTEVQYAEAFAKTLEEGGRQRAAYAALERALKDFTTHTLGRLGDVTRGPRSPQKVKQVSGCFATMAHLVIPLKLAQEGLETALLKLRSGHEARGLAWPEQLNPRYGSRSASVLPAPDRATRRALQATNQDLDALEARQAQALVQAGQIVQIQDQQRLREAAAQEARAAAEADQAEQLAEKERMRERWHAEREALAARTPAPVQPEPSPEALAEQQRQRQHLEAAAEDRQRHQEREAREERLAQLAALRRLAAEGKASEVPASASAAVPAPAPAPGQPGFVFLWHPLAIAEIEALDVNDQVQIQAAMDKVERGLGKGMDKHSKRLLSGGKGLFELRPQGGRNLYRPIFTLGAEPRTFVLLMVRTKASLDQDLPIAAERAKLLESLEASEAN